MSDDISTIIEKHRDMVFKIALGYVKNIHDADDIAQNVFVKFFIKEKKAFSNEEIKAWLIRVAINEAKNLLKSAWLKKRAELDESLTAPENGDLRLYDYVKKLKPKYRTVIYLHYYEGYKAHEIAAVLKIPQSTVLTQMQRAREQLKTAIIKEEGYYGTRLQSII